MDLVSPTVVAVIAALPTLAGAVLRAAVGALSLGSAVIVAASTYLWLAAGALFRFILLPVSLAWTVLFFLLSPAIYTVAYVLAPFWYLAGLVPKLQPLYVYLGSAAFVGIIAGISVKIISNVFVVLLRLDREDETDDTRQVAHSDTTPSTTAAATPSQPQHPPQLRPSPLAIKRQEDYFGGSLSPDIDWQVIDRFESRGPNSEHMRRMPLLQSIILEEEEDDSSGGGY